QRGLAGGVHAQAGLEHAAEDHLVHLVGPEGGPAHGFAHGRGAQLHRGDVLEGPAEGPDGSAAGGEEDSVAHARSLGNRRDQGNNPHQRRPSPVICPNCFDDIPDNSRDCRACGVNFARWAAGADEAPARGRSSARSGKAGKSDKAASSGKGRSRPVSAAPRVPWSARLRRAGILLAVLAVLAWLVRWPVGPALDRLSVGGLVVYVSSQDGGPALYALDPGQKTARRLTHGPGRSAWHHLSRHSQ